MSAMRAASAAFRQHDERQLWAVFGVVAEPSLAEAELPPMTATSSI